MCISVILFLLLFDLDKKHILAVSVPVWFAIGVIMYFEKKMPYKTSWKPSRTDVTNDALYLLLVQTLLPQLFVWLTTWFMIRFITVNNLFISTLWPHQWPIAAQELLLVLCSDLLRYWLHRFNHTIPFLWRFHAVHHSVQKMYWLNTSRFHPFEKAMQFLMDVFPFMILGVSEKVIALHLILYGVNGFFQHCNIDLKFGWLNYIISSTELHRWHHSKNVNESNSNYGNNVSIWDLVFGSLYLPKNKSVEELGLVNKNYPQRFHLQLKSPFIDKYDKMDLPQIPVKFVFLNFLLKLKMRYIKYKVYNPFIKETKHCDSVQNTLLMQIISINKETDFGKEHNFKNITSYNDFINNVPLQTYDTLLPYIHKQAANKQLKALVNDDFLMFNKTSGTTSDPKWIPVTQQTLNGLKISQDLMVYNQYQAQPFSYYGTVVGIASPAIESMSQYQIPIGSASGQFYKNVSALVRTKYVIPYEILEIQDYELKYYTIMLFCLQNNDITYVATANPTTLLKLAEVLNTRKFDLLKDLRSKTISGLSQEQYVHYHSVLKQLNPKRKWMDHLEMLFHSNIRLSFKHIWPYLKQLATWTGGSCGVALHSLKLLLPDNVNITDLGYLSSELRGTVTFDAQHQSGLATFSSNFFEFAERVDFENKIHEFKRLHELDVGKSYYVFVTTTAGLYRYNMNDIITVTGYINKSPLFKFIQKGKGVCNITGEKLYESQLLHAINTLTLESNFIQVVANEEDARYELYIEDIQHLKWDTAQLAAEIDKLLSESNIEYQEKRSSGRLKPMVAIILKAGAYDSIKKIALLNGQSEGQYKTMLLTYKSKLNYDLMQFAK